MIIGNHDQFIDSLFDIGAIQFGCFTLKSDDKSPIYINFRLLRSCPPLLREAAKILYEQSNLDHVDRIADVPTAATPFVSVIAATYDISMISPREAKGYGSNAEIDGIYHPGERVRLYDDLVTTAGSKMSAIKILEAKDLIVTGVTVLVDREQGGASGAATSRLRF